MIALLDTLLRKLFTTSVPGINTNEQVRFQPPDEDWRAYVKNLVIGANHVNSLNVYLIDLRENRKLRSNERVRTTNNGNVDETPAPRRIDCHYLISAWSPADVTPSIEPTVDEHALLYDVARSLSRNDPLVANDIFAPGPTPAGLVDQILPIVLLPAEGFPKLGEFWQTMGDKYRWKPCVYLVATVPITSDTTSAGPMVTTVLANARRPDVADAGEVLAHIGGTVVTGTPPAPVPNAWVELMTTTGVRLQLTRTDPDGHFVFEMVQLGTYRLRASTTTLGPSVPRTVVVPSPTGEYDLVL